MRRVLNYPALPGHLATPAIKVTFGPKRHRFLNLLVKYLLMADADSKISKDREALKIVARELDTAFRLSKGCIVKEAGA